MLLLALGLALTLTLTLALAPAKPTLAASITGGSTGPFLAFTVYDSCPSGWVAYNTYTARTIKAMRTGAGLTAGNTFSAGSGDQVPSHSHSATGSLSGSFPGVNGRALITNGNNWVADQGTHYLGGFGVSSQDGQTPFVTLQLCRYTGATTLWAADGLITFVTNDVTDCPSGWTSSLASFEPNGRFITFAAPGVNPFASSTGGVGDSTDVGSHSHSVPGFTMGGISQTTCCSWSLSGGGNRAAYSSTFNWNTDTAGTTGSSLNIPYVTLRICRATPGAPSPSPIVLPDTQLFFLAETAACPTLFTEVTATFSYLQGRLPWLLHSAGGGMMRTMRGTQFPRALSTSGAETAGHSHTLSTSYTFRGAGWASATGPGSGGNSYNNLGPYGASWGSGSTAPGIPYLALRACRPADTASPTRQPTNKPTTRSPTGGPTTSYPTYSPSRAPTTSKPSAKPSRSPSRAPTTSKPSASPTTSKPSSSPTTSAPSRTPSRAPTLSPTPAPVWVNVCSGNDQSVFQNYDNYVLQRGACAELCNVEFLKGVKNGRECALAKCSSIDLYTTLCKQCIVDEINCQTAKCKVSCQAYRYSDTCAACTNDNCRSQFQRCSGLQGSSVDAGGGDGGSNKPPPISNIPYGLIGGVIGGVIGGLGLAFFAVKRWRERGVTTEMTTGFERRIFGRTAEEKSAALAAARAAGGDDELVSDNPNYRHASRGAAAVKITGTRLRAKYSFHGDEDDEVDVPAGAALTAIERSAEGDWYVVKVDETGAIGCIPASYTVNAG